MSVSTNSDGPAEDRSSFFSRVSLLESIPLNKSVLGQESSVWVMLFSSAWCSRSICWPMTSSEGGVDNIRAGSTG